MRQSIHSCGSGSYKVIIQTVGGKEHWTCKGRPFFVLPRIRQLGPYLSSGYSSMISPARRISTTSSSSMLRCSVRCCAEWHAVATDRHLYERVLEWGESPCRPVLMLKPHVGENRAGSSKEAHRLRFIPAYITEPASEATNPQVVVRVGTSQFPGKVFSTLPGFRLSPE